MHHPTDKITHTTAFVTPVVEHWLEREYVLKEQKIDWKSHHYCLYVAVAVCNYGLGTLPIGPISDIA